VLLLLGAVVCVLSTVSLLWPGTPIDIMWQAKPESRADFATLGGAAIVLLVVLGIVVAFAGFGLLRKWFWSWLLAVVLLAVNGLTDFVRVFTGDVLGGLVGFVVAGGLAAYLLLPRVRGHYRPSRPV
jgi:hypothetical protein